MGLDFYSASFEDLRELMTQPVSCFNCHGNEPGTPTITHPYLADTFKDSSFANVSMSSAACAQCHIEYHFNTETWEVVVPWASLADMAPTNMLNYYNNDAKMADGQPYADFVNPRSGVRVVKVQHPEFETVYGPGAIHNSLASGPMAFSCADCHMPREVNEAGVPYISHEWMSPLNNMQLIEGSCFACHADLHEEVRVIQEEYQTRLHTLGNHLADLTERLVEAVESGQHSEETLNEIREAFRSSQFFWDFVMSENSNGAHNSRLLFQTIENGWEYANEVESLLEGLGH
jgi:nitrite reductase (cytochrome c-552)